MSITGAYAGYTRDMKNHKHDGFTIIELLVVIVIIGILVALAVPQLFAARERAYMSKAMAEFNTMRTAVALYREDNGGEYPPDSNRNLPQGLENYIGPNNQISRWPIGPWPGSVYDYDAHEIDGEWYYQISIRYCAMGQPETCKFPRTEWAKDFTMSSSVYFCLEGACRAHSGAPINHPAYCVNCGRNDDN